MHLYTLHQNVSKPRVDKEHQISGEIQGNSDPLRNCLLKRDLVMKGVSKTPQERVFWMVGKGPFQECLWFQLAYGCPPDGMIQYRNPWEPTFRGSHVKPSFFMVLIWGPRAKTIQESCARALQKAYLLGRVCIEQYFNHGNYALLASLGSGLAFTWSIWNDSSQGRFIFVSFSRFGKHPSMWNWWTTRWWFQIFLFSSQFRGNDPIWLIFFRWVETTNWFAALNHLRIREFLKLLEAWIQQDC